MINIEFGPSTLLGLILLLESIGLYFIRTLKPNLSKDYDIFFSSLGLLAGGILIFQGWRLDPILLFGQMLSSGTAMFFILESIQLRALNEKTESLNKKKKSVKEFKEEIQIFTTSENKNLKQISIKRKEALNKSLKYTNPMDYLNETYRE